MNKKVAIALTAIAVVGLSYPAARLATAQTKPFFCLCKQRRRSTTRTGL